MSPKLEGPLMSIGAHGTIANALTYSMRGGRARAAIYRPPHDARTQAQLNQRAHYLDGTRLWKLMTAADRLAWSQTHQLPNASGYNTFVQTIMNRITRRRHWLHQDFFSQDPRLQNFIMIHLMENYAGSTFDDLSGNDRHWSPTNTTQEQGDRGQAALLTGATASTTVDNSTALGDLASLTVAIRFRTSTPHGSLPGYIRLIGAYNYGAHDGFILSVYSDGTLMRLGDGVDDHDVVTPTLYTVNAWNNLVVTFDAADSGRVRIFLNGAEIANETTAAVKVASCSNAIFLGAASGGTPFPGYIDNAVLYRGATSAIRI